MSKLPLIIVASAALLFSAPPAAHASTTFTFTGACTPAGSQNCSGFSTGTLVLQNYTQGNAITDSNFVSFTYHSNVMSLSFSGVLPAPGGIFSITGDLQNLPGPANVAISTGPLTADLVFESLTLNMGNWCAGSICGATDFGSPSSWSVPLPATLPLFATGLGGLGLLGWRRKRKARAV
jgi:hypothetical protein